MSFTAWVLTVAVVCLLLTWAAILDLAFRDFGSLAKKAAWAAAVFVPGLGAAAYFAFGMRQGVRSRAPAGPDTKED
ncbi:MAG: PLDc N-terminal domain-containing protein [Proteobacteria bacterium]|nr:PLDc N-terminal domain-containing protein [Pseudomonadota bacterium]